MAEPSSTPSPATSKRPPSKQAAVVLFLFVLSAGLFADLFTKWLAFDNPGTRLFTALSRDPERQRWQVIGAEDNEVKVIPRLLHFHATTNEGAVFGLGQGQRSLFVIVSVAAIAFLIYLVTRTRSRFEIVLYGCLLAGVLGNMYDRVRFAFVRDMILAFPDVRWPGTWTIPFTAYPGTDRLVFPYIFNVADCLLVCGVGALLIRSFWPDRELKRQDATSAKAEAKPAH